MIKLIRASKTEKDFTELALKTKVSDCTKALKKISSEESKLKILLKRGAKPNKTDLLGRNVLFYNVHELFFKEHETVHGDVTEPADSWCIDKYGMTPLFYAKNSKQGKLLIDNIIYSEKHKYYMPEGVAWHKNIVNNCYLNHQAEDGKSALFHNDLLTEWLLEEGAYPDVYDIEGRTPLFYSNEKGTELLLKYGAEINSVDDDGNNALFFVETLGQAKMLVRNHIDITHKNKRNENCLHYIVDKDIVLYLVGLGIVPKSLVIEKEQILKIENARKLIQTKVRRWLLEKDGFEFV